MGTTIRRLSKSALVALLAAALCGGLSASPPSSARETAAPEAIIIDHTCTDLSQIPEYWIERAKDLAIHYAHTSHGSQVLEYLPDLEAANPLYNFSLFYAGNSPPTSLNACEADALCIYDGNPPETYIEPGDYWETSGGRNRTRAVANTGLFDFSMWSWCGQASYYSDAQIQQYLDTMAQFEAQYPAMRFILMTGHTDGGSAALKRHNAMIRQYAINHGMVLFDFADIETYDPLGGGPYANDSEGNCEWCVGFCNAHPEYCTDLPGYCAHTDAHPEDTLFCKLKGNAYWWMMARLAGWDGTSANAVSYKAASATAPRQGDTLTYTIVVRNLAAPPTATVYVTDVVPAGLTYVAGSLTATAGAAQDGAAPTLTWTGTLSETSAVTITYAVTVSSTETRAITNTAIISVPGHQTIAPTAVIIANGESIHLPLVRRNN